MKREIVKITAFSVLSIAVLGGAFVGINQMVLANALNKGASIEPVTTNLNSEEFQELEQTRFNLLVTERFLEDRFPEELQHDYSFDKPENALTKEAAAQIGAQYIYEMLSENIEGKRVEMSYYDRDSQSRPYWEGRVGISEADIQNHQYDFRFVIDAVTGERIGIENNVGHEWSESVLNSLTTFDKPPSVSDEQIVEYTQLVQDFAERHFTETSVNSIRFKVLDWLGATRNDSGEFVVEWIARFDVVDDTGRFAAAAITLESQQLRHFSTEVSDNIHLESDRNNRTPKDENSPTLDWVLSTGETIFIVDNTWMSEESNPDLDHELTPFNLSIEEAAEIAAQLIYEEFGDRLDGMRFDKIFRHSALGEREFWNGFVYDDEAKQLFYYVIDARTGERIELSKNTADTPFLG